MLLLDGVVVSRNFGVAKPIQVVCVCAKVQLIWQVMGPQRVLRRTLHCTARKRTSKYVAAGVLGVHDMHVWSIGSGKNMLTAHVDAADDTEPYKLIGELEEIINARRIAHSTVQICSGRLQGARGGGGGSVTASPERQRQRGVKHEHGHAHGHGGCGHSHGH